MRAFLGISVLTCLSLLGCASDESVICERLAECDLLPEGLSESDCEEQAVRQVPEERLAECADCVDEKGCDKLTEACRNACEPGD